MARNHAPNMYAYKQRQRSPEPKKRQSAAPAWSWLIVGVSIGLLLATLFYLKLNHDQWAKQHHLLKTNHPSVAQNKTLPSPKFDFYTLLPKMKVSDSPHLSSAVSAPQSSNFQKPSTSTTIKTHPATTTVTSKASTLPHAGPTEISRPFSVNINSIQKNKVNSQKNSHTIPHHTIVHSTYANKPQTTSFYLLQLGSSKTLLPAAQLKAKLFAQGYMVTLVTPQQTHSDLYKLMLGPFPTLHKATQVQQILEKKHYHPLILTITH